MDITIRLQAATVSTFPTEKSDDGNSKRVLEESETSDSVCITPMAGPTYKKGGQKEWENQRRRLEQKLLLVDSILEGESEAVSNCPSGACSPQDPRNRLSGQFSEVDTFNAENVIKIPRLSLNLDTNSNSKLPAKARTPKKRSISFVRNTNSAVDNALSSMEKGISISRMQLDIDGVNVQCLPSEQLTRESLAGGESGKECPLFLHIEVEDHGMGLSAELMANLFKPFKQTKRMTGGTGLGLYSLAKRSFLIIFIFLIKKLLFRWLI